MNGNPLMMIMNAMRAGGNPMQILQSMAGNNPQVAQGLQMINGKSPQQVQQMAENMAKQRGVDAHGLYQAIAQQFGMK